MKTEISESKILVTGQEPILFSDIRSVIKKHKFTWLHLPWRYDFFYAPFSEEYWVETPSKNPRLVLSNGEFQGVIPKEYWVNVQKLYAAVSCRSDIVCEEVDLWGRRKSLDLKNEIELAVYYQSEEIEKKRLELREKTPILFLLLVFIAFPISLLVLFVALRSLGR